ncbi:hypothetical protein HPB52_004549 [Rhipicephalus sanguineus]|uniref:Peptidase aspartic putative domain-containing protein n=1 Tax=Rhipicephalus sanguineus TaxID=34632 RepID=A0A9D4PQC7_RHISA|nr:hypothetical protein HPB52_004549 [Rhipicephalus sanguineus]
MASAERAHKNRGVVRASVTQTLTLLTDELQASVPDAAQLVNLNKDIFDATDDDAYGEELEAEEDYDRKVSYAVSLVRFFLREAVNKATPTSTKRRHRWCQHLSTQREVEKLRLLYDKVQFLVTALTGLGVSPDQYNVILKGVLMKCLPDEFAILYRQKAKGAPQDTSGIATPEELFNLAASARTNVTTVHQAEPRIARRDTSTLPVTSVPSAVSGINAVLLQRGRVRVECGSRKRLVRILLNSGSQRKFIRADVSKDLRCPVIGNEELALVTFDHSKPRQVMRSRRVALTLRSQRRDIAATVEPHEVCIPGFDVYWKVATGRIDRLTSDLTAVQTKWDRSGNYGTRRDFNIYERSSSELQHDFDY